MKLTSTLDSRENKDWWKTTLDGKRKQTEPRAGLTRSKCNFKEATRHSLFSRVGIEISTRIPRRHHQPTLSIILRRFHVNSTPHGNVLIDVIWWSCGGRRAFKKRLQAYFICFAITWNLYHYERKWEWVWQQKVEEGFSAIDTHTNYRRGKIRVQWKNLSFRTIKPTQNRLLFICFFFTKQKLKFQALAHKTLPKVTSSYKYTENKNWSQWIRVHPRARRHGMMRHCRCQSNEEISIGDSASDSDESLYVWQTCYSEPMCINHYPYIQCHPHAKVFVWVNTRHKKIIRLLF